MTPETKKLAQKLIIIAAAGYLAGCKDIEPKHFERLTEEDRQELVRLLNEEIER